MNLHLSLELPEPAGTVELSHGRAAFPLAPADAVGVYVLEFWEVPDAEFDWRRANPDAGIDEVALEPVAVYEPSPDATQDDRYGIRRGRYVGQSGRPLNARMAEYANACREQYAEKSQTSRMGSRIRRWLAFEDESTAPFARTEKEYFEACALVGVRAGASASSHGPLSGVS